MPHAIPVSLMSLDLHRASLAAQEAHGAAAKGALVALHQKIAAWRADPSAAAGAVILAELAAHNNNKRDTAEALEIPRRTFYKLLEELHLHEQADEQAAELGLRVRRGSARFGDPQDE